MKVLTSVSFKRKNLSGCFYLYPSSNPVNTQKDLKIDLELLLRGIRISWLKYFRACTKISLQAHVAPSTTECPIVRTSTYYAYVHTHNITKKSVILGEKQTIRDTRSHARTYL